MAGKAAKNSGFFKKIRECEKRGHPHAYREYLSHFRGKLEARYYCPDCNSHFNRNPTQTDLDNYYEQMNKAVTI